jgi:hypothetical protein
MVYEGLVSRVATSELGVFRVTLRRLCFERSAMIGFCLTFVLFNL